MKLNKIKVDSNLLETVSHGTIEFPMDVYRDDFSKYYMNVISWHWHPEIEFVVVLKGRVEYHIGEDMIILDEGDGVFVNSNQLHMSKSLNENKDSLMFSVVASPSLLYFDDNSLIYKKYIKPIVECCKLSYLKLSRNESWQSSIISHLRIINELKYDNNYGYEFMIQNNLQNIWQLIMLNTSNIYLNEHESINDNSLSQLRLKQMLEFIHENYFKNITIDDISRAANISRSECFRCFNKMINTKPFSYLTNFRLERALKLLIETDISISDICYSCGFNHSSYFGKLFKDKFKVSPSAYRKGHKKKHSASDITA